MAQQYPQGQIVCPVDGAADTIQKVSAIVHGAALGGRVGQAAPATLIQMLMHKEIVEKPKLSQREGIAAGIVVLVAAFWACGSAISLMYRAIPADIFLLAASVVIVVLLIMLIREHRKVLELRQGTTQTDQQKEHFFWEQLYYCHRHDVVFLPGLDMTVAPQHMHEFLRETRQAMDVIAEKEALAPASAGIIETQGMDGRFMA